MCHKGDLCDLDIPIHIPDNEYKHYIGEEAEAAAKNLADVVSFKINTIFNSSKVN